MGVALSQSACYYVHLAGGQWRMWSGRQPLEQALASPQVGDEEKELLALVPALRSYARELGLEADKQYRHYVAGPSDRVLTNVVATAAGQIEAHPFRFPVVGRLPYKGFFDPLLAEAEASRLRAEGFDVCVSAVPAYSTLGWLSDPVTTPMLQYGDGVFVEMALHEWVHATIFVRGNADFNEGIATFVGQEGAARFFDTREGAARGAVERARIEDERAISEALADARGRIEALYRAERVPGDRATRAALRAQIEAETRGRLGALELRTRDPERVAARARLGDACLALVATYDADLERYRVLLRRLGGDLARFVSAARHAAGALEPRAALLGAADSES
jgi:predicted aminopeptidase